MVFIKTLQLLVRQGKLVAKQAFEHVICNTRGNIFGGMLIKENGKFYALIEASRPAWTEATRQKLLKVIEKRNWTHCTDKDSEEYKCELSAKKLAAAAKELQSLMKLFGQLTQANYQFGEVVFYEFPDSFGFYGPFNSQVFVGYVAKLRSCKFVKEVRTTDTNWVFVVLTSQAKQSLEPSLQMLAELQ